MELRDLLLYAIHKRASDLHLTYDTPPILRVDGKLIQTNYDPLSRDALKKMIYGTVIRKRRMRLTGWQKRCYWFNPKLTENNTDLIPFICYR